MLLWIDVSGVGEAQALFRMSPVERLRRSAAKSAIGHEVVLSGPGASRLSWPGAGIEENAAPLGERLRQVLNAGKRLVAVDGANGIDPRLIGYLLSPAPPGIAARGTASERAVVLRLDPEHAQHVPADAANLLQVADALLAAGILAPVDEEQFPAYVNKLRRTLPYWIYAVPTLEVRKRLERQMFWDNYKGSTDLLTRYVYPPIVWPLVNLCIALRISPNAVTLFAIVLCIAAVPLFANGEFFWGFVCAYGMSVLDSVDGKIARVTLTDSRIGNMLDHGMDWIHPPFWYAAWAWGLFALGVGTPLLSQAAIWLVVFYFADRAVLHIAKRRVGFALHAATPLDGKVRSFIARRNITMTIMAIALLVGMGPAGFYLITAWQVATTIWHAYRAVRVPQLLRAGLQSRA